ncbi:MAG: type II toxin-antitoxin system RelE/ParE family toxin [Novosphingobium sp.]|nr:type II toxin-antitoxin system RelE/ParE family toxin [Novosphingobium sp.]
MVWTLEYLETAQKALRKLGKAEADRITKTLGEIAGLEDPRSRGHALTGNLTGLWRYRIGDWRVITRIEAQRIVIVVV